MKPKSFTGFVLSLFTSATILLLVFALPDAEAKQHRHHEAHEHGVARMNVAVEGDIMYIEFSSPAANIVGFEHYPETREQKDAVKEAEKSLEAGEMLFVFSPEAAGRLTQSGVESDIGNDSDHEPDAEDAHEHHEDEDERHSEFRAEYRFLFEKPEKLAYMDVMLFRIFPGIERIEVQLLTGTRQTALELTAKEHRIGF